jgi:hypothetical protein
MEETKNKDEHTEHMKKIEEKYGLKTTTLSDHEVK